MLLLMTQQVYDHSKLQKLLENHRKDFACPMCQKKARNLTEQLYELRPYSGGDIILGGVAIVPIIPVTCEGCGNTVLINAVTAGVFQQTPAKK